MNYKTVLYKHSAGINTTPSETVYITFAGEFNFSGLSETQAKQIANLCSTVQTAAYKIVARDVIAYLQEQIDEDDSKK